MPSPDPVEASKAALRREMAEISKELGPYQAIDAGHAMAAILSGRLEWSRAERIGLFAGLGDEPDTRPVFAEIQRTGKRGFFPRCLDDGGLEMAPVEAWADLRPGSFGVLEPAQSARSSPLSSLDLLLLPGVAFDRFGRRLGRGAGFYDRALAGTEGVGRPKTVGVGFAFRVVERVPIRAHDRRVDAILTEQGWTESMDPG